LAQSWNATLSTHVHQVRTKYQLQLPPTHHGSGWLLAAPGWRCIWAWQSQIRCLEHPAFPVSVGRHTIAFVPWSHLPSSRESYTRVHFTYPKVNLGRRVCSVFYTHTFSWASGLRSTSWCDSYYVYRKQTDASFKYVLGIVWFYALRPVHTLAQGWIQPGIIRTTSQIINFAPGKFFCGENHFWVDWLEKIALDRGWNIFVACGKIQSSWINCQRKILPIPY
jgi:hypothetical protein